VKGRKSWKEDERKNQTALMWKVCRWRGRGKTEAAQQNSGPGRNDKGPMLYGESRKTPKNPTTTGKKAQRPASQSKENIVHIYGRENRLKPQRIESAK